MKDLWLGNPKGQDGYELGDIRFWDKDEGFEGAIAMPTEEDAINYFGIRLKPGEVRQIVVVTIEEWSARNSIPGI